MAEADTAPSERPNAPVAVAAALVAVLAQLIGLFGWSAMVGHTDVRVNHGHGASCDYVDMPPEVPLDGIETRDFEQGWSWAPPGLTCKTQVDGDTVVVRQPSWDEMAGPVLTLFASLLVTAGVVAAVAAASAPHRRNRWPILWGLIALVAQPMMVVTVLTAIILPGAV